jgi:hypothetical protein
MHLSARRNRTAFAMVVQTLQVVPGSLDTYYLYMQVTAQSQVDSPETMLPGCCLSPIL